MNEEQPSENRLSNEPEEPRVDKPLHGPRKPALPPLLLTLLVLAVVALVFLFIWGVLVPSD